MSYKAAQYWWITCDAPDCGVKSTDDDDYSAWSDQGTAWERAYDSDWVGHDGGSDGPHYCPDHRRYVCTECEWSTGVEYPLDQDGMCDRCWERAK